MANVRTKLTGRFAAPALALLIALQRLLELRVAKSNERWARERGAVEYGREHYPLFFLLHGGWLASLLIEGRRRNAPVSVGWLLVWLFLQPARMLVIRTLGRQWNTRILIVPGARRVTKGPFRFVKHPNYLVVAAELLSGPLGVRAPVTAAVFGVLNALLLLLIRIPAEERALRAYENEKNEKVPES